MKATKPNIFRTFDFKYSTANIFNELAASE